MPIITIGRDYCTYHLLGNAALFSRVLKMGTAAIRADNHRFIVLSFIGIGFLVLFLGAHPASLRTNSSSMIAMPNALSLHARHFPLLLHPKRKSQPRHQRQSSTISTHFATSTRCFEYMLRFNAGQPKRRAFYTMSIRIPPAPLGICTASPSVTYLYS